MMAVTHMALSLAATTIAVGTADPGILLAAAVASQLPDIDTTKSLVGRAIWPVAAALESRFPHRGLTHSFIASSTVLAAAVAVCYWRSWSYSWAWAIGIAYFVGWFSDSFTKAGVCAFWPAKKWLVIPANPNARLATGSSAEYWVLAIACGLLLGTINLISTGGLSDRFQAAFFRNSDTAIEIFRRDGSAHEIKLTVNGLQVATGQKVSGDYVMLGENGTAIIAERDGQIFRIADDGDIKASSIAANLGAAGSIKSETIELEEVAIADLLAIVGTARVNGQITLDPSGLELPPAAIGKFQPVSLSGQNLVLSWATAADMAPVGEEWALRGSVTIQERIKDGTK